MTLTMQGLVCIVGLLMYLLINNPPNGGNPKVSEVGRIMFWTALLSILFNAPRLVTLFGS